MPPKPHTMNHFIYHPAFCHLVRGTAIPATIEVLTRRDSREDSKVSGSHSGEDNESTASAPRRSIGQRVAALRAAMHLSLPRINIRAASAAVVSKAVTLNTFAWRGRTRPACPDPAIGALRNSNIVAPR